MNYMIITIIITIFRSLSIFSYILAIASLASPDMHTRMFSGENDIALLYGNLFLLSLFAIEQLLL